MVRALGLPPAGAARRLLGPLLGRPAGRFAGIVARADGEIGSAGLPGAARSLLADLRMEPVVWGERGIPEEGPLLVASNHPGAYDSLAIMAAVPRKDLKVIISDVGLTRAFPAARDVSRTARIPTAPVQAFALPLFATIPRSRERDRSAFPQTTGAAATLFRVKTTAETHGRSLTTSARSGIPVFLIPQNVPAPRNPGTMISFGSFNSSHLRTRYCVS